MLENTSNTELLYLNNTYHLELDGAIVLEVNKFDDGQTQIVLDKTIFYPQGGGQPSDIGWMTAGDGKKFEVKAVRFDAGKVFHTGIASEELLAVGDVVSLSVESTNRLLNARNHTAGHCLSVVVERLYPSLVAQKGYHFADGAYVEFDGVVDDFDTSAVVQAVATIVEKASDIPTKIVTKDELAVLCKHVPEYLPTDKPIRAMFIDDEAIPCGGTHLKNTAEIGGFEIRKVKAKGGKTKVSYSLV